jgi:8-amino-7-oxononanoate synthase
MNFTSALYLGMTHSSQSLDPWEQLTTGRPDALYTPRRNRRVAADLAALVGCQQAMLGPSTFHLFGDLFNMLADDGIAIYLDRCAYPIAHWGAAQARGKGIPLRFFRHHDPAVLGKQMASDKTNRHRPVVVTDGFCPGCGKSAPIAAYLDIVRSKGGCLVIDDTQALGIWGSRPDPVNPYGSGGGGSLRLQNTKDPCIILISSLAKGFGAPLAMIAGSKDFIRRFRAKSQTQVHCSPPSAAAVSAAKHALAINAANGNALRRRLAQLVRLLRQQLTRISTPTTSGLFPVQSLILPSFESPQSLHHSLQSLGVRTVLHHNCNSRAPHISFLITIRHTVPDIRLAGKMLAAITFNAGFAEKIQSPADEISSVRYQSGAA